MQYSINHNIDIALLDEDSDEVMTMSMRVIKKSENTAGFTNIGESDRTTKYISVTGKDIFYVDSEDDFGTFISEVYDLDDIEAGLENNGDYSEEECKLYAKAIELICNEILHISVTGKRNDSFLGYLY